MGKHCDITGLPAKDCPCGACWDDEDEPQDGDEDGEDQ